MRNAMPNHEFPTPDVATTDRTEPLTTPGTSADVPSVPQPVAQPLTRAAIFLVVTVNPGAANRAAVRSFCGDLTALVRAVGFRDLEGNCPA